jgi:hypothetical protein
VVTQAEARRLALALPATVELDHHGRPSFRVGGRIVATLWTERAMNIMAGEDRIRCATRDRSDACSAVFWGKRLSAVQVDLALADRALVEDLLDHAWRAKAPARLRRELAGGPPRESG